jgi:mannose-6-phosphate isomerase-like protein (cupin superfamily)
MLNVINWNNIIENSKYDESVGIRIAKIAGNDEFSTFITAIDPGKSVNAHYHKSGEEHYHIISGSGQIQLKNIKNNDEKVSDVMAGESFVVEENILHKLINNGSHQLLLMFSCPLSHLDYDRYFL